MLYVLKECDILGIPSFTAIETDILAFTSSYFLCGNSSHFVTEIFIGVVAAHVSRIKNKKYFSLFSTCFNKEFLCQKHRHIKFFSNKFNIYFYFRSVKRAFKSQIAKIFGGFLKLKFSVKLRTPSFFIRRLKRLEKKKRKRKFFRNLTYSPYKARLSFKAAAKRKEFKFALR